MKIEEGLPDNPLDESREARVARGARLLDEKRPGWRTEIDRDHLDMTSDTDCVLGQLYERYAYGLSALNFGIGLLQAQRYGFIERRRDGSQDIDGAHALQVLWLAELDKPGIGVHRAAALRAAGL